MSTAAKEQARQNYEKLKRDTIKGWNTWNTWSILSHVLMPEGFAINLCMKDLVTSSYLKEADVGNSGPRDAVVFPGAHAYDGSYTQLKATWMDITFEVESATIGEDLVLLINPVRLPHATPPLLIAETGILWNRAGYVAREGEKITAHLESREVDVFTTGRLYEDPYIRTLSPYLCVKLQEGVGFSTGTPRFLGEIRKIVEKKRIAHERSREKYGPLSEAYNAMQTCMAWDTVYDPLKNRMISTVSRRWNYDWSGYVMFCWDNYFASCMASVDSKAIAYSNVIEITAEMTPSGFVPNFASSLGASSWDRSQPPVGSISLYQIYKKYREKWIVELLFDDLFRWNTWFYEHRMLSPGLLAWGSDPSIPAIGHNSEIDGVNTRKGAALESGLDNSPMYDDIPFDSQTHLLQLADVGLTGLFIMDCGALKELALVLGRKAEAQVLDCRRSECETGLKQLWDEENGFFYNKLTHGRWSRRVSPTNFYALFSAEVTKDQADRIVKEHFYNSEEFWGEYIMPSIARNDPAYPEQEYWRGRIWAPMNFLVYLALKKSGKKEAAKDLARLSEKLILKEWLEKGHVHENYCANTGEGCNRRSSDAFYHWGGLLSYIALMENGFAESPFDPLK